MPPCKVATFLTAHRRLCAAPSQARSAALCVLDTRVAGGLAGRFPLQHRSTCPRLCAARGTYAFTSHADRPLVVWDLRAMSVPLAQCERLDHGGVGPLDAPQSVWQCVGPHGAPAPRPQHTHQALWLACSECRSY